MVNDKHKWKVSFYRPSSSRSKPERKQPPEQFVCPISGSLMADPVIVSSGQSFERNYVQVCRNLGFSPILSDGSKPDFSTVIPNLAIKSTILNWCDASAVDRPKPPELDSVEKLVRTLMASQEGNSRSENKKEEEISVSEKELLKGVAENPPVKFNHATTEVNRRPSYSSSGESVLSINPISPLPFTTRPSCYSSSSSSEIVADETLNPSSAEEEEIVVKLESPQVFEQEEGVKSLRNITRTMKEIRVPLCTTLLLSALQPLLNSKYSVIQINAVAAVVNISLEKINKVKIVRSGIVPPLIDILKGGYPEAQEHAAGAIFSLALDDENKTAIGVLGALQPLIHSLRSKSQQARQDSALALYHLSLVQGNRSKLVKLGSIPTLLGLARSGDLASRVLLILCNLAACAEGRAAMIDANAVECLVGILRRKEFDSEATRENCVAALYSVSQRSLRFKGLAREAGAVEVLREVEERGSERAREQVKRMLQMMRGREEWEADSVSFDSVMESGVMGRNRYRLGIGKNASGANTTEF
ncbi:hypothetical protein HHK36_007103 [Tetracentron sinense]|uniref:RING-type E3 ubiquitin transferase n=1 Tax=Tetracentron sinense TaxID=13715 RepID=A0A834ZMR8_TETSI|nr:hypothetical protein HHK36_007103 [Tetracentron sinense]